MSMLLLLGWTMIWREKWWSSRVHWRQISYSDAQKKNSSSIWPDRTRAWWPCFLQGSVEKRGRSLRWSCPFCRTYPPVGEEHNRGLEAPLSGEELNVAQHNPGGGNVGGFLQSFISPSGQFSESTCCMSWGRVWAPWAQRWAVFGGGWGGGLRKPPDLIVSWLFNCVF